MLFSELRDYGGARAGVRARLDVKLAARERSASEWIALELRQDCEAQQRATWAATSWLSQLEPHEVSDERRRSLRGGPPMLPRSSDEPAPGRSHSFDARKGSQQRHERPMTDASPLLPAHLVGQAEVNTLQNANIDHLIGDSRDAPVDARITC